MSEISDEMSQALCCAAAVRLDGALAVLADRAQLSDRYNQVVAGVESVIASLGGQSLDTAVLGRAFGANWTLGARYPIELPGGSFFRSALRIVDIVLVATRPGRQATPEQGLEHALEAATEWPAMVQGDAGIGLAGFELACQQEAHERLREGGLPALWKLAAIQAGHYRKAAEMLVG
ncbi:MULTISPECIES: hypothetical protein [unclassified Streptomyces]|uniref:hypothetical protein n=1 Tax=unclassified Streptomyces TaxID=2593676 RepID=UPI002E36E7CA|nr:hypothetical protein [Streptomyces sp. NBC_01278]